MQFNHEFLTNPYPFYAEIRAREMPHRLNMGPEASSEGIWMFGRYDDVAEILKLSGKRLSNNLSSLRKNKNRPLLDHAMLLVDPPDHTRLRRLAARSLSAKRVRAAEAKFATISEQLLSGMAASASPDFITSYATPFPIYVIADLLGVPATMWPTFSSWNDRIIRGYDSFVADDAAIREQHLAFEELFTYLRTLIAERRREPKGDLTSALIHAHDDDAALTDDELLAMCAFLLVAGNETTTGLIGNGMHLLMRNPQAFESLKHDPTLIGPALEEVMRCESPLQRAVFRVTTGPCVVGGQDFREGEILCAVIGSANRDAEVFDRAEEFDITRSPNPHLAFGAGIHLCLGAALARTLARIAFSQILDRFPDISPVEGGTDWNPTTLTRRLRSLPVRL